MNTRKNMKIMLKSMRIASNIVWRDRGKQGDCRKNGMKILNIVYLVQVIASIGINGVLWLIELLTMLNMKDQTEEELFFFVAVGENLIVLCMLDLVSSYP